MEGEDLSLDRRTFMQALAASSVATMDTALDRTEVDDHFLEWFTRIDHQVWEMFDNAADRVFYEPSAQDWAYHLDHIEHVADTFIGNQLLGNGHANDVQENSPDDAFTSTAIDGAAAGVSMDGRMTNLQGPRTGNHQIPYYIDTGEGASLGIEQEGEVDWIHDEEFEHLEEEFGHDGNSNIIEQKHRSQDWEIEEETYVLPGTNTVVRDYRIKNVSGEHQSGSALYRMQANANNNQQDFVVWKSNWNQLTAGDGEVLWDDEESPNQIRMFSDEDPDDTGVMETGVTDVEINESVDEFARKFLGKKLGEYDYEPNGAGELIEYLVEEIHEASLDDNSNNNGIELDEVVDLIDDNILNELEKLKDSQYDALQQWGLYMADQIALDPDDGFEEKLEGLRDAGEDLEAILDEGEEFIQARYGAGHLSFDLDLASGEEKSFSIFKELGEETGEVSPEQLSPERRKAMVHNYWQEEFKDLNYHKVRPEYRDQLEFDLMVLMMLRDLESGKESAAGTLIPTYTRGWPRDMAFAAEGLLHAGKEEYAKDICRYLADVIEHDGSYAQCYDSHGEFGALMPVEYDQSGQVLKLMAETHEVTGDDMFGFEMYPTMMKIGENLKKVQVDNDLAMGSHDFREMIPDIYLSLWTNAHIYKGAKEAAEFEEKIGGFFDAEFNTGFEELAKKYGDATKEEFIVEDGEDYLTEFAYDGPRKSPTSHVGHVFLTDFAEDYDVKESFIEDWEFQDDHEVWKCVNYDLARAMLQEDGHFEQGKEFLEKLRDDRTEAGYIPEFERDGEYLFSLPFAWAHSSNILAEIAYKENVSEDYEKGAYSTGESVGPETEPGPESLSTAMRGYAYPDELLED